eukprot:g384.t1
MIPTRIGSTRLPLKNLRLLDGRFLCEYALRAAALSGSCDRVVLNADFDSIEPLVDLVNSELKEERSEFTVVEFFRRPSHNEGHLAADEVVATFMNSNSDGDTLVWVNPTNPLQTSVDLARAIQFMADRPDTNVVIGAMETLRHVVWKDKPNSAINFESDSPAARTQDLRALFVANYCVLMWRYSHFLDAYKKTGAGYFSGNVSWMPTSHYQNVVIKTESDLRFAEEIIQGRRLLVEREDTSPEESNLFNRRSSEFSKKKRASIFKKSSEERKFRHKEL